MKLSLPIWKQL